MSLDLPALTVASVLLLSVVSLTAQAVSDNPGVAASSTGAAKPVSPSPDSPVLGPGGVPLPADYVIGPEDVLGVLFWRETDMSAQVTVRSDGKITLPLLGDVVASGKRPDELKLELERAAAKYLTEPNATVAVREVHSLKVYILGEVKSPGPYPLTGPRTVLQLIALAGGLNEFAKKNDIRVIRTEQGKQRSFPFHYEHVAAGKALGQNLQLLPGDTVVVP